MSSWKRMNEEMRTIHSMVLEQDGNNTRYGSWNRMSEEMGTIHGIDEDNV